MCDCKSRVEGKLLDRFKEQSPEATAHSVKLNGYAFIFGDSGVTLKGCMVLESTACSPLKKGGSKTRTTKQSLMFTFCPFCGEKYDKED